MLVGGLIAEVIKVFLSSTDVQFLIFATMISVTLLYIVMNFMNRRRWY